MRLYKYCKDSVKDITIFEDDEMKVVGNEMYIVDEEDNVIRIEEEKKAGELTFVFEKDVDDEHVIQVWRGQNNKYYKFVIIFGYKIAELLTTYKKKEAMADIEEMSTWEDEYNSYCPYDDDEIVFIL